MATIQAALRYHLTHDADVAALVSTRVYAVGEVPSSVGTSDFVAWQLVTDNQHRHQVAAGEIREARYRFHCIATTELGATQVAAAVADSLADFRRGDLGDPADAVAVRGCFEAIKVSDYEPPTDASQRGMHSTPVDFTIWYVA